MSDQVLVAVITAVVAPVILFLLGTYLVRPSENTVLESKTAEPAPSSLSFSSAAMDQFLKAVEQNETYKRELEEYRSEVQSMRREVQTMRTERENESVMLRRFLTYLQAILDWGHAAGGVHPPDPPEGLVFPKA